jgi:hypothetical protein
MRNACNILFKNPEGKRPPGRSGCRWKDYIKIALKEIRWEDGSGFIWLRVVACGGSCEHGNDLLCSIRGW